MEPVAEIVAGPTGAYVGAFFDLDGTLVEGFTAAVHLRHRIRHRQARLGELTGTVEAALRYRFGRMKFEHLLQRAGWYLRGESLDELDEVGEFLCARYIEPRVYADMRRIVRAHQEAGHTLVLSSSAMTMHAAPVARVLGIPHVICNSFAVDESRRLTGAIVKPIVWGSRKAEAVGRFCVANNVELQQSYFYADGEEDLALMRTVGHPRPVNPRPRLAAAAAEHGWPVLRVSTPRPRRFGIGLNTRRG
jgi:HAD superfamily hydrolase (TIGR01490 family)